MLNQVVLVGRIAEIDGGGILLNVKGINNNDNNIFVELSGNILDNVKEYCQVSDLVGVKGHLQGIRVIADKITFLSRKTK